MSCEIKLTEVTESEREGEREREREFGYCPAPTNMHGFRQISHSNTSHLSFSSGLAYSQVTAGCLRQVGDA